MNHEPNKISIGEHMIRMQMFMGRLSDMMPQIKKTVFTIIEIKKLRKERLMSAGKWGGEGAESAEELNEDTSVGDGGFGVSSLPIR
jgi:hypothetical protein